MPNPKSIGVFCGALNSDAFQSVAIECGEFIGKNGYQLVYGGSSSGLMGLVAAATRQHGGRVVGVFPTCLPNSDEKFNGDVDEPIIVNGMMERKEIMISLSDIFMILPGGFGTLDEFFEILTLRKLLMHNKKIIVVNHLGYWDKLAELLGFIVDQGFAHKDTSSYYRFVDSISEAIPYITDSQRHRQQYI